jgi:hypothetical protein
MSEKGKAIAVANMAIDIEKVMINAQLEASRHIGLVSASIRMAAMAGCEFRLKVLARTPHQWFNDEGRIDKRKKRRHERKCGAKVHTARILRRKLVYKVPPYKEDIQYLYVPFDHDKG